MEDGSFGFVSDQCRTVVGTSFEGEKFAKNGHSRGLHDGPFRILRRGYDERIGMLQGAVTWRRAKLAGAPNFGIVATTESVPPFSVMLTRTPESFPMTISSPGGQEARSVEVLEVHAHSPTPPVWKHNGLVLQKTNWIRCPSRDRGANLHSIRKRTNQPTSHRLI